LPDERRLGLLQGRDSGFAANGGKIIEEFVQALPAFEIVKQRLERDAGSPEYGY